MQFQILESMPQSRRSWSKQEDKAIIELVSRIGTKKWSLVSQAMKEQFGLLGRSGKQCRQRWHNHLNPNVNKKPWSDEQERIVFEAHKKLGNKWTEISKLIDGRTDNAIKNYFYSSIRRSLRRINKYLGSKNSTMKMKHIKPTVLSLIFNFPPEIKGSSSERLLEEDCKCLTSALIEFSKTKIKATEKGQNNEEKNKLEVLIVQLMKFNENYESLLNRRKKNMTAQDKVLKSNCDKNEITVSNSFILEYKVKEEYIEESENSINLSENEQKEKDNENIRMIILGESMNDWSKIQNKQAISRNYISIQSFEEIDENQSVMEKHTPSKSENSTVKCPIECYAIKKDEEDDILKCAAFEN